MLTGAKTSDFIYRQHVFATIHLTSIIEYLQCTKYIKHEIVNGVPFFFFHLGKANIILFQLACWLNTMPTPSV